MSLSDNDDIFICVSSSITMNFIDEQTNIHLAVLRTRQVPRSGQDRSGQVRTGQDRSGHLRNCAT